MRALTVLVITAGLGAACAPAERKGGNEDVGGGEAAADPEAQDPPGDTPGDGGGDVGPDGEADPDPDPAPDEDPAPDLDPDPDEEPPPDGAELCSVWDGRMKEWPEVVPPLDCKGIPLEEIFLCGEYWFWRGLQDRVSDAQRSEVFETMTQVIEAGEDAGGHDLGVARMYALRGQLGLAMLLENGIMDHLLTVVPDFERTLELDPGNTIIPTWIDTMELVIKHRTGDPEGVMEVAERAWQNIELCRLGNIPSLNGTAIGLPLSTGIPQKMGTLLDEWVCEGAAMCDGNTELAPWGAPGMLFEWAESYLRLGRVEEAREYMLQALEADGADEWPFRPLVQDTLDHLDEAAAEFAAVGDDQDVFMLLSANQRFGCVFCHAESPPADWVQTTRIRAPELDPPGGDEGEGEDEDEGEVEDEEVGDHEAELGAALVGAWAFRTVSTTVQTTPLGDQESTATAYGLAEVEEGPDGLMLIEAGCRVEIDSGVIIRTSIDDSAPRSAGAARTALSVWQEEGEDVVRWARGRSSVAVGWAPARDADEELPTEPDDPRVTDPEGDGNPGVTVRLDGIISGELYVAQRNCSTQRGELDGDGVLVGGLDAACSAQSVLGADNPILEQDVPSRPHADPDRHRVRYVPLDEPWDCDRLIDGLQGLFD